MTGSSHKIGMIGSEEAIMGFIPLGVACLPVKDDDDIESAIQAIQADRFAVVFITEDWAERARPRFEEAFKDAALPALVVVPSPRGTTGVGLAELKKIVEQAVGSDILFQ